MGSIVAVLARSAPIEVAFARQMLTAAPHRGSNFILRTCGNCLLGVSNKRDFIDATISTDGQLIAVFSGTLDNAVELARYVADTGNPPSSAEAADVVVAAFKAFGPDAPNRMRGVFAGVVTNGRQMWCFRDHLGFKPLYYRNDPRAFFAATEVKQIIAGAGLQREPDLEVLEQIFYGRMPDDMPSALKGVSRLPKATTLAVATDGASTLRRYWHPETLLETTRLTPAEVGERFSELFGHAVARCLTGNDVISLSGGIDSPAVAAFAAPQYLKRMGRPLSALSAVFPDLPAVDERAYIELITDYLSMDLHTHRLQAHALDNVKQWCTLLDGPVPTVLVPEIHEYYALAHQLGFCNILTGELAEFVFTFHRHLLGHLLTHRRWKALMCLISTERRRGASWRRIGKELTIPFIPGRVAIWYLHVRGRDGPTQIPDWLDRRKVNDVSYRSDLLPPGRFRWSAQQLVAFDGSTITMDADELCAAVSGVTVRRPFTDIDLWEFFLSLPAEIKFPDLRWKTLERRLLRDKLPDAILDRRNKTFFDDHLVSQADYATLRQLLANPNHHVNGVDYQRLAAHLEREDFNVIDCYWANDLARIHSFLSLW